jgi:hypothetical protein
MRKHGGKLPLHKQLSKWVDMEYSSLEDSTFSKGRFGYEFNMDAQLAAIERTKTTKDVLCRLCYEISQQPWTTEVCRANARVTSGTMEKASC